MLLSLIQILGDDQILPKKGTIRQLTRQLTLKTLGKRDQDQKQLEYGDTLLTISQSLNQPSTTTSKMSTLNLLLFTNN